MFLVFASTFDCSERSLLRLCQKGCRMSFIQYYKLERILKVVELVLDKKLSVKEVAEEVGYNNVPKFSNTLFQVIG
jgi:transcriptional regulator GlxA family with amidase domain